MLDKETGFFDVQVAKLLHNTNQKEKEKEHRIQHETCAGHDSSEWTRQSGVIGLKVKG